MDIERIVATPFKIFILSVIFGLPILLIGFWVKDAWFSEITFEGIDKEISEINNTLPEIINEEITFSSVARDNYKVIFTYTVMDSRDVELKSIYFSSTKEELAEMICSQPAIRRLLKQNYIIVEQYVSESDGDSSSQVIERSDCEQSNA